jgi:hypothetical protein
MNEVKKLIEDWRHYKEVEKEAQEARRFIENQLTSLLKVPEEFSGSKTKNVDGFEVKVSARKDIKVDVQAAQEVASANNLAPYLDTLFRWKAEVKARDWEKCDPRIIELFQVAITERLSRPSFKITELGEDNV